MIGAGDGKRDGFLGAPGLRRLDGLQDAVEIAGNDELAGAIEVGEGDSRGGADLTSGGFVESDHRSHASAGGIASFLHESTAESDDAECVLETEGAGRAGAVSEFNCQCTCGFGIALSAATLKTMRPALAAISN